MSYRIMFALLLGCLGVLLVTVARGDETSVTPHQPNWIQSSNLTNGGQDAAKNAR